MEDLRSNKFSLKLAGVTLADSVAVPKMPLPQWTSMEELLDLYTTAKSEVTYNVTELGGLISIKAANNRGREKSEKYTQELASKIAVSVKNVLDANPDDATLEFLRAACIGSNEAWIMLQMSVDGNHHQSGALAGIKELMEGNVEAFPLAKVECIALFILACTLKPILKDLDTYKAALNKDVCIPFTLKDRKWAIAKVSIKNAMVISMCRIFRVAACRDFCSYRKLIIAAPNEEAVVNPGDYKKKLTDVISKAAAQLR